MTDISLCLQKDCKIKESCKRFKKADYVATFYSFISPTKTGEDCEHFWAKNQVDLLDNIMEIERG